MYVAITCLGNCLYKTQIYFLRIRIKFQIFCDVYQAKLNSGHNCGHKFLGPYN